MVRSQKWNANISFQVLRETGGVISSAATRLGVPRTTLNAIFRFMRILLLAMLLCQVHVHAQPQPPCGTDPVPPYPGLDDSAIVKLWSRSDSGSDWKPPACTSWTAAGFTTLVTTVARFRQTSDAG